MKDNPVLYRKRMIPEECVLLKDDKFLNLQMTSSLPNGTPSSPRENCIMDSPAIFSNTDLKSVNSTGRIIVLCTGTATL